MGVQLPARWVGAGGVVECCLEEWEVPLEGAVVLWGAGFKRLESGGERRRHQWVASESCGEGVRCLVFSGVLTNMSQYLLLCILFGNLHHLLQNNVWVLEQLEFLFTAVIIHHPGRDSYRFDNVCNLLFLDSPLQNILIS